jgi:hypothetical protein
MSQNGHLELFNTIHITKYGNIGWNQLDIEEMKSRIVGKDLFKPLPFDPAVDAVSQATMSSYLIFEGLNETKIVLKDFSDNGFRKEYWRGICFNNLHQIKKTVTSLKERYPTESFTSNDQTTLDREKLQRYLPSQTFSRCPTDGQYLLIQDSPLCSIHGLDTF